MKNASRITGRSGIASQMFENFKTMGWPQTILVTGEQNTEKKNFVLNAIQNALFENQLRSVHNLENIHDLLVMGEHPDYYAFSDTNIPIGKDSASAEKGSVRHLLRHFIPYAPHESKIRFVVFENAARIRDTAESALLKILEEPPKRTHFILRSHTSHDLKETIRSRCLIVPFVGAFTTKKVPVDPWDRFWFFSGQLDSSERKLIDQINWADTIKKLYDHFSYTNKDFLIFDSLGPINVKKHFPKATIEEHIKIVILNLLPLYFSLRDNLFEGKTPTIGPIRVPNMELAHCYGILINLRKLFFALRKKYFHTRSVNPLPIYYQFINKLTHFWIFKN